VSPDTLLRNPPDLPLPRCEMPDRLYGWSMAAKRNWIQEERRRTLGDWVAFCPTCGHVVRYFEDHEELRPTTCPQCETTLVARCPSCDARIPSAFQVACEDCGAPLRPNELFGGAIRRPGR
jgi:hypothetical protein